LLNIQTRSQGTVPANNFTVARFRRDLLKNSDAGFIFTNRQSGQPNDYNRTFGADVNFYFLQKFKANVLAAKTQTPGLSGQDWMYKAEGLWDDGFSRALVSYLDLQENFNPEVGYLRRPGRKIAHNEAGLWFKPKWESRFGSLIRDILPEVLSDYSMLPGGITETKNLKPQVTINLQDGSIFGVHGNFNFQRLSKPFFIDNTHSVPPGDYTFDDYVIDYTSNQSRVVSGNAWYQGGDWWNGYKKSIRFGVLFQPGYKLSVSLSYQRHHFDLPDDSFNTHLAILNINYSFNPKMFLSALIQYNSTINQVSSNIRFRLIHHPLSDLFLVYNDQRDTLNGEVDRSITLKFTHLFNF
jgi:hypothetical protein